MSTSTSTSAAPPPSQGDTSLWLHNKLGTSNDSWTGGSIVSQLNPDILAKIQNCFQDLQPQVKLKLLLSLFHIPRRNLEQWRQSLQGIIDIAKEDSEPWVCMLAELMKTYPTSGTLNSDIQVPQSNRKMFSDLLADLKRALKKTERLDTVLPVECHYLNKNAFISVVGHTTQTIKHFSLKRKAKAAALKADLINKSQEAANKVKSASGGSFPMRKSTMPRKMSEGTPLKGMPSRSLSNSGFRLSSTIANRTVRKPDVGGVKLIDIEDQPIGYAAAKKRKRQQEIEEMQAAKMKKDQENKEQKSAAANDAKDDKAKPVSSTAATTSAVPVAVVAPMVATKSTPDYAAGLSTLNPPTPAPPLVAYAPPTPAYAPPQPSAVVTATSVSLGQHGLQLQPPNVQSLLQAQQPLPRPTVIATTQPTGLAAMVAASGGRAQVIRNVIPAGLSTLEPLPPSAVRASIASQLPPYSSSSQLVPTRMVSASPRVVQLPTQPMPQVRFVTTRGAPPPSVLGTVLQQRANIIQPNIRSVLSTLTPQPPTPVIRTQQQTVAPQPTQQQTRRSLTLTKEQALEAQEMFRTANKVTRPEKALILGFMAGSRDNPCPHLGNVVTIKLSENQENVLQADQTYLTMIVETHFQMNYSTGEWRRIKKYRRIEDGVPQ